MKKFKQGMDSLKIEFSQDAIKKYDKNKFKNVYEVDKNGVTIKDQQVLNTKRVGINSLIINNLNGLGIIEISSKIKGKLYLEGIRNDTYESTMDSIKEQKIIEFEPYKFLETALVYKLDVRNDLKFITGLNLALIDLNFYAHHQNYRRLNYGSGVEIYSPSKRNGLGLVAYDKFREINRNNKVNRFLRKSFDVNECKGLLRIESRLKTFKQIRKYFNIPPDKEIKLSEILTSEIKVNFEVFNYLFPPFKFETLSGFYDDDITINAKLKKIGASVVLSAFNYDLKNVNKYLKEMSGEKSNPSEARTLFKKIKEEILLEKSGTGFKYIEKIRELLSE